MDATACGVKYARQAGTEGPQKAVLAAVFLPGVSNGSAVSTVTRSATASAVTRVRAAQMFIARCEQFYTDADA